MPMSAARTSRHKGYYPFLALLYCHSAADRVLHDEMDVLITDGAAERNHGRVIMMVAGRSINNVTNGAAVSAKSRHFLVGGFAHC